LWPAASVGEGARGGKVQEDGKTRLAAGEVPVERTEELGRKALRFRDPVLEAAYREDSFRHALPNLRFALLGAAGLWVMWGFVLRGFMTPADRTFDLILRYGVFIPMVLLGFVLSLTPIFRRIWEWLLAGIILSTMVTWIFYVDEVQTMPPQLGYVGLILIAAFSYTLVRLRYLLVVAVSVVAIAVYLPYAFLAEHIFPVEKALAALFLVTFAALGGVAAYRLELANRLLFVREGQLDRERERSDALLLNILPSAIVDRLKAQRDGGRIAEDLDEVSVVFADAVDSTRHAAESSPEEFAETLDRLFRRFDQIADRHGLEKIKTIGDAYMAVAGAPVPAPDHAIRAADAALDFLHESGDVRWPTGEPIVMRVGMATGPAVAGVIGQRKFAYDLWGDTVNLASRLSETHGEAGRIQVTEDLARRLADRYEFSENRVVDLKGKGPTRVCFLLGRHPDAAAESGRRSSSGEVAS
jgi:class 3 adenylate cyclase